MQKIAVSLFVMVLTCQMNAMEQGSPRSPRSDTPRPTRRNSKELAGPAYTVFEDRITQELEAKKNALIVAEEALTQQGKEKRQQGRLMQASVAIAITEKSHELAVADAALDQAVKTKKEEIAIVGTAVQLVQQEKNSETALLEAAIEEECKHKQDMFVLIEFAVDQILKEKQAQMAVIKATVDATVQAKEEANEDDSEENL